MACELFFIVGALGWVIELNSDGNAFIWSIFHFYNNSNDLILNKKPVAVVPEQEIPDILLKGDSYPHRSSNVLQHPPIY